MILDRTSAGPGLTIVINITHILIFIDDLPPESHVERCTHQWLHLLQCSIITYEDHRYLIT